MKLAKLEDFGARGVVSPQQRKEEYARQCKELPRNRQAKFWLKMIEHDPEVARLCEADDNKKPRRPWQ